MALLLFLNVLFYSWFLNTVNIGGYNHTKENSWVPHLLLRVLKGPETKKFNICSFRPVHK